MRWMVWCVCPESDMARLSGAYSMVSCHWVSLFRPPALTRPRALILAPNAPKRVETVGNASWWPQKPQNDKKFELGGREGEKRGSKSQSDLLGGDARSRRVSPRTFRPKARLDRRPGSTDCPGTGMQKAESRFEAGQIWWSGVSMMLIGLPIDRCC